jgi:hypothetical protein
MGQERAMRAQWFDLNPPAAKGGLVTEGLGEEFL